MLRFILFGLLIQLEDFKAVSNALLFRADKFDDVTELCQRHNGKPPSYILKPDKPAMYVSIDPGHPIKSIARKRSKLPSADLKLLRKLKFATDDSQSFQILEELANSQDKTHWGAGFLGSGKITQRKLQLLKESALRKAEGRHYGNKTFDCSLHFETELPKGDKTSERYDALSMIIIELDHNARSPPLPRSLISCTTFA